MQDYEKLGVFYLGKRYEAQGGKLGDEPVLYDSRDLTTHAVIIGMTGSGKTGLGIDLLEEAAIDKVPVIALDDLIRQRGRRVADRAELTRHGLKRSAIVVPAVR